MVLLFLPWSSLCLCRQESHLRQKRSLRRTRAWCGSCWSSCGLAWTCPGWCCPPSSWSRAPSLTSSPTTTTTLTCSPSKQHTGWAWPGHFSCTWENISVCARKLPDSTEVTGFNRDQARHQLSAYHFIDKKMLPVRGKEGKVKLQTNPPLHMDVFGAAGWSWWEFSWGLGALHNRAVPPPGVLVYIHE